MSDPVWPPTTSSNPCSADRDDGLGSARRTWAARERRRLDEVESDARDRMHQVLIASPWQRYQMDRDAARSAGSEDET